LLILATATLLAHFDFGNKAAISSAQNTFIEVKGNQLRYFQKGTGKDILFVHGTPGSIEDWAELMDSLSANYRVTAFDRPGHGFSSPDNYDYHIEENAAIVEELIKRLNLKNPLIVGHSYGGSTAANLAANHRLQECELIIIDSPLYSTTVDPIYRPLALPVLGKGIALLANFTIAPNFIEEGVAKATINTSKQQLRKIIDGRKEVWLQPKVLYSKAKETSNYYSDLQKVVSKYPSIQSKITIVTGANEVLTLKKDCVRFHKEVPNSELVIFENTGHYIQFDQFDKLLKVIRKKAEVI